MQMKPDTTRPPSQDEVSFDLDSVLGSVVALRAHIPDDALTASILGTERAGHGVAINDTGLVLTIGYLITEAESVWLVDNANHTVPALRRRLRSGNRVRPRAGAPASRGPGAAPRVVRRAGPGGTTWCSRATGGCRTRSPPRWSSSASSRATGSISSTRRSSPAPAHPNWGGAAVIGRDGTLRGIGSLLVQHMRGDEEAFNANMVVPTDLLKPILDELLTFGRQNKPGRPWLGMMTTEYEGHLVVAGVTKGGPAETAGVEAGDVVIEVNGESVSGLATMFRRVWNLGEAGVSVPLTIYRSDSTREIVIESINRDQRLKRPSLH